VGLVPSDSSFFDRIFVRLVQRNLCADLRMIGSIWFLSSLRSYLRLSRTEEPMCWFDDDRFHLFLVCSSIVSSFVSYRGTYGLKVFVSKSCFPLAPLAPSAGPTADKPPLVAGLPPRFRDSCTNRAGKRKIPYFFPFERWYRVDLWVFSSFFSGCLVVCSGNRSAFVGNDAIKCNKHIPDGVFVKRGTT